MLLNKTKLMAVVCTVGAVTLSHPLLVTAETKLQNKIEEVQLALVEKTTPMLAAQDQYFLETPEQKIAISVRKTWETGHASVYINNREVIKFRSGNAEMTPYVRARQVAYRLYNFLNDGGKAEAIKPTVEEGKMVIKLGEDATLLTVDSETAKASGNSEQHLAQLWADFIRKALGGESLQDKVVQQFELWQDLPMDRFAPTGKIEHGMASWYGPGFHGRRAANGSRYDMNAMTAAHKKLPFGTIVRVYNHRTGKSCLVKITDRGPFIHGRIIDLSKAAAKSIGMLGSGVAKVTIEVVVPKPDETLAAAPSS